MADPNFANRTLFHGDNLPFLRGMDSETVDLVATDPPFNKSKDFHATPDSLAAGARFSDRWSWDKDVHPDWVDSIKDDWPGAWAVIESAHAASGSDMAAFLCWLGVRVMELHRVLKPTGSFYLHIDHTAQAYTKALLDGIFGPKQFRNEVIWKRTTAHSDANRYGANTDRILFYTKGKQWTWNQQYLPYDEPYKARFKRTDPDGRRWADGDITAKGLSGGGYEYEYKGATSLWRVPLKSMERLDAEGRLHFTNRGGIRLKKYLDELPGYPLQVLWTDIDAINSQATERQGYPTQKPLALYERIVKASSKPGDLVLDPFCGCATTPVAAERLGRQWVGMDIWDGAFEIVKKRMEDNRQLLGDIPQIHYSTTPPARTDTGQEAAPTLVLKLHIPEPPGLKMSHAEMKQFLINNEGIVCKGCLRKFDDERYLDLDHNVPRSDGGINHISNRMLLCGPCNRAKSNTLTLSGLRKLNKQNGWMARD